MMNHALREHRYVPWLVVSLTLCVFFLHLVGKYNSFASDLLLQDDLNFVVSYVSGQCEIEPRALVFHSYLCLAAGIGDIWLTRLGFFFLLSLVGFVCFFVFRRLSFGVGLSLVGSVLVTVNPSLISQGVFLTGSYPSLALVFVSLSVYCLVALLFSESSGSKFNLVSLACFICLILAGSVNSTYVLLSLFLTPIIPFIFLTKESWVQFVRFTLIALVPMMIWWYVEFSSEFHSHYLDSNDKVSFRFERILARLQDVMSVSQKLFGSLASPLVVLCLIVPFLYLKSFYDVVIKRRALADRDRLNILMCCTVVGGVLSIAPASSHGTLHA